jgi:asparagine synthase (glutamine-hydrolysing)
LIRVAQGRQIVIPLSGGYDSRLIALLLKRSGYDNILAYSDQSAGSKNAQVAEQVADNLGIPWTTVEVGHSDWHSFYNSQKWNEYFDRAAYLGGLPTPEHIIILETLLQEGEISPDAIVVPGDSSLDTMKATPPELEEKDRIDIDDLTEEIISQHFKYNTHIDLHREEMAERISETIGAGSEDTPKSAVEAFERWRLKERRTKLIINGSRAFDFVGLDWWIPLEDRELYQFWRKVPPEKKRHRSFYEEYIEELYKRVGDVDREEATEIADTTLKSMVADRIRDYPIWDFTKAMYETWVDSSINKAYVKNFKLREIYEDEPRYGVMSEDRLKSLYEGQNHIFYSILAQATVGRISLNSNDD